MFVKSESLMEAVCFYDDSGVKLCEMELAVKAGSIPPPIVRLSKDEAREFGEEQIQLLESTRYHYILKKPLVELEEKSGIVERSPFASSTQDYGTINTGNLTGLLTLRLLKEEKPIGLARLEVRSKKVGYREDYQQMLQDIADHSIELLLRLPATTETRLTSDLCLDAQSIQQRFFFLRALLSSSDFNDAINQVTSRPHVSLRISQERQPTSKGIMGREAIRQLSYGSSRVSLPAGHPLSHRHPALKSLPRNVVRSTAEETVDTPENRFVKFVVEDMNNLLSSIEKTIKAAHPPLAWGQRFIKREVLPLQNKLEEILGAQFFRKVNGFSGVDFGSPVLQKKQGYREILQTWLKANAAAKLAWRGGEDLHQGGQRDIPTLYEYWVFFVIWSVLERLCCRELATATLNLFESSTDGFGLKLRSGKLFSTGGLKILHGGARLRLQFSYNRTFNVPSLSRVTKRIDYESSYPSSGSWTRSMRPDFTISVWAEEITSEEAELNNSICHVHFDTKYSVSDIMTVLGHPNEEVDVIKKEERFGCYRRGDLLKMHSYKDAIRRTHGAYIIYPGNSSKYSQGPKGYHAWLEFHEVLPGLGAFQISPGVNSDQSAKVLHGFLLDILDQFVLKESKLSQTNCLIGEINK